MTATILSLSGYGVCFGRKVVLADINLELPERGVDVLMGPVKSGKSTLMRSLSGLNQSSALHRSWGHASLRGQTIGSECRPVLVQQHATILNLLVRDALLAPTREQGKRSQGSRGDVANQALADFGLGHLQAKLADSVLSLPPEWQRAVNILSHALTAPLLLMIDEPTYGLDELAAGRLIEWLAQLGKSFKLLVALHHQGQARRLADRVILLGGGHILAHETKEIFFHRCPNRWVEQFVRTGGLPIASPGVSQEEVHSDAELPPPLTSEALAVLAEFEPVVTVSPVPVVKADSQPKAFVPENRAIKDARGSSTKASIAGPDESAMLTAEAIYRERPLLQPTRARLPDTSPLGVQEAAVVGHQLVSEYRGPNGFRWIVPNRLAGCPEPGVSHAIDYDMSLLRGIGVTHLLTLTETDLDQEALARNGLKNLHISIFDREAPSIRQAYMVVYRMQAILNQGGVLAVHCRAGIGRTGTMLAAWLIREGGLTAAGAIQRLRKINPAYVQSELQEIFLYDFEQDMNMRI